MTMKISVIIPTLNEAETLPVLLSALTHQADELIVVDGGSTDRTCEVAQQFNVQLIHSGRGRGRQFNAGAKAATGDLFWFLHADSVPPANWRGVIDTALKEESVIGGGFSIRIDANGFRYRLLDFWGNSRTRFQKIFYGDQGIFVRREIFKKLNGFSENPQLEDLDFSYRLSKLARPGSRPRKVAILPDRLKTSARRWQQEGFMKTVLFHCKQAIKFQLNPTLEEIPSIVTVVAVTKAPTPGQVKTRLIPAVGEEGAAQIAKTLLLETVLTLSQLQDSENLISVSPAEKVEEVQTLLADKIPVIPQTGGDLGQRLAEIFHRCFSTGSRAVLILGTDHPDLPLAHLQEGVNALLTGEDQLVLGPAEDGGYYAIGLTREHPSLFEGIPWSTDQVLRKTKAAAEQELLKITLLPAWSDLDEPEDLSRFPRFAKTSLRQVE